MTVDTLEAGAALVASSDMSLQEAVDELQAAAVAAGLVDELGQDAVQATMAAAFGMVSRAGEIETAFVSLADCMNMQMAKPRPDGAAASTVEALMLSLRERGETALTEPDCRRRLAELSDAQLHNIIDRLIRLQPKYPAVTDGLLRRLHEQLP